MTRDDLIRQQTSEVELPPEVEAWFARLAGCVKTRQPFDSLTDSDRDADIYDEWDEEVNPDEQ